MSSLLTNAELAKMRLNTVSCTVFEKERLLAHIEAQAQEIVALRGILKQIRQWIMGKQVNE